MKNVLKFLSIASVVLIAGIVFVSCSKDDDPADNDVFVGTYNGRVTYQSSSESKSNDNGNVRVIKVGSDYNFIFSDGIPDLTGVRFRKDGDNTVVSVDEDVTKIIRITASKLTIGYAKDGATWTADCDR